MRKSRTECVMCGDKALYLRATGRCQSCENDIDRWTKRIPADGTLPIPRGQYRSYYGIAAAVVAHLRLLDDDNEDLGLEKQGNE